MFKKTFLCACGEGGNALFLLSLRLLLFCNFIEIYHDELFCLLAAVFDLIVCIIREAFLARVNLDLLHCRGENFFHNFFLKP